MVDKIVKFTTQLWKLNNNDDISTLGWIEIYATYDVMKPMIATEKNYQNSI